MDNALSQYYEKRTTMAESIKQVNQLEYPVLIFCPEPGFKPSFFKNIKAQLGIERYLWKFPFFTKVLKNVSSIATVAYSKDNKDSQNVQSVCIQFIHNQVFDRF